MLDDQTQGNWTTCTYADYAAHVEQTALLLMHVGYRTHTSIGILAFNCAEGFNAELGALHAGGVVAGIYSSSLAEAVYHVLHTSDATVCIVYDSEHMTKVRAVKSRLPHLRAILQLHAPYEYLVGVECGYYGWTDLVALQFGQQLKEELLKHAVNERANECALLIYTLYYYCQNQHKIMSDTIDLPAMGTLKPASSYISTSLHEAVKLRLGKTGLAAIKPQTIPEFFRECCIKYAQRPALRYQQTNATTGGSVPRGQTQDNWTTCTFTDYAAHVEQAALLLLHIGLQPHSSIGILAFNCPEWFFAELGALRAGGVVAGIYPSNSAEAVHHVLDTSEATVCIVDDKQQMAKVRAVKSRLPRLRAVVQLHGPYEEFVGVDDGYYRWSDLVALQYGEELKEELLRREMDVMANECALLIYTSGTVGMPKAVMLSHDSVLYDSKAISKALGDVEQGYEVAVSYLPLNHVAAQIFDVFMSIENGACLYFADRNALKGTLGKTLSKARPTRFFGVPRVYEKIEEKLTSEAAKSTGLSKYIMEKARQSVERYHTDIMERKSPSSICYWFASKVTRQIKYALGLDRCKSFIIGGAPVNTSLKHFFLGIDMPLDDLFGMSETSGGVTLHEDYVNLTDVGRAIEGVEIKIYNPDQNGQGEICIRGRTVFMGYLNDLTATKETIKDDGWMHTGDMGFLDIEGNLNLSGRIKELIITAGGENIPPVHIEELVKSELSGISNAMLVGDHRKFLTMLLTIKTDLDADTGLPLDTLRPEAVEWLQSLGLDYTRLSEVLSIPANMRDVDASNVSVKPHPKVLASIEEGIERANSKAISNAQRVQKFSLLPHDFTIPTGELGPTLKLRRNIVMQKYGNIIENMYKL